MTICHACKKELALGRELGRKDECLFCHADLHCCRNCAFYDVRAPRQCREPQAGPVHVKDKANFCDYFTFTQAKGGSSPAVGKDAARKALDDLFKK